MRVKLFGNTRILEIKQGPYQGEATKRYLK